MKNVTLLFLMRDHEVLLAMKKRGFGAGKWNGVGGKVEADESVEQAAVRECREEIGVTPLELTKLGTIDFYDKADPEFNHFAHIFTATEWDGTPVETEEMRPGWFPAASLPYEDMWKDDSLWMPYVINGERFAGVVTLDGDEVAASDIKRADAL